MENLFERFSVNPILRPTSICPSRNDLKIECLLNPGVFRYRDKIGLLLRVAERPKQKEGYLSFLKLNDKGVIEIMEIPKDSPDLDLSDVRVVNYQGEDYLTTMSHLRLVWSTDGVHFSEDKNYPAIFAHDAYTAYGIEDCRVSQIGDTYYLTFSAVSSNGVVVGMKSTKDWLTYQDYGPIFPPHNKDCAIFERKINGRYYALHRPSSPEIGGNYMWISESPDLIHWGNHRCIARTRKDHFDSSRLGAGASPIPTEYGWLSIYHGATENNRYCLGALLLDLNDPTKVIARSQTPIMEPEETYEIEGFFGEVIFTNGHIVRGDELVIYYGAADEVICGAKASIRAILSTLV